MMAELLPDVWAQSAEMQAIQAAIEPQAAAMAAAWEDILLQLDVATATWGLALWEAQYGIAADLSRPDEYRRSRILSKIRGSGTTTAALIQNVAESFSNGAAEVIEHPGEYRFEVKFIGTVGIPPNLDDLTAALEEIKPAHLAYSYIIIYRTWADVKAKTWGALKAHTWADVRGGSI